jgi:AraC-like DNA-binding protein/Tfp pilus assembly protein PilF
MYKLVYFLAIILLVFNIEASNTDSVNIADSLSDKFYRTGLVFIKSEKYNDAINCFNKAELYSPNSKLLADILNNRGLSYDNIGDHKYAMKDYLKALSIYDRIGDTSGKIKVYNRLGNLYRKSLNKEKCLDYYFKSLELCISHNNDYDRAIVLNNIGLVYLESDPDKALNFFKESYYYSKKVRDSSKISVTIQSIAQIYLNKQLFEDAMRYFKAALDMDLKNNYKLGIASNYCNMANIMLKTNQIDLAKKYLDKSYLIATEINSTELLRIIFNLNVLYYGLKGQPDTMWYYTQKADSIREMLYNLEGKSLIAEMQTKYETEKKENTIDLLQANNRLRESQLKIRNYTLIFLLLIVGFMGIILMLNRNLIFTKKNLLKKNLELVNNEADRSINDQFIEDYKEGCDLKYSTSNLDDTHKEFIKTEIARIFNNTLLFLENSFDLTELSQIIGTNKSYVSQVINETYNRNFNSLLNDYRIKEARKIISDPANHKYTIETIAGKVGYNSKTSFNNAFKKYTGLTPSFYIKSIKAGV